METLKSQSSKINLEKLILYDKETNVVKCLAPECQTVFAEKNELAIKRHYHLSHNINIEKITTVNNGGDSNPNEYLNNEKIIKKHPNINVKESFEDKGSKAFRVSDYVEYCKETNTSKCLIKNCERLMSDCRNGNIKRHYQRVHDFVIVHSSSRSNEDNEVVNNISEQSSPITVNIDNYFEYDPITNNSLCKVPGCNASLVGKNPNNVMRHYNLMHNYNIESNESNDGNKSSIATIDSDDQFFSTPTVPVGNLVEYDIVTCSYQCLFLNCNQTLEFDLTAIKKHYYKIHKIIISKDPDNIPERFLKKRKYRYVHEANNKNDELTTEGEDKIIKIKDHPDLSKTNEALEFKERKKFSASNYVEFCESTNISKCLIKNCKRLMSGLMSSNIKRHYQRIHNMIIMHGFSNVIDERNEKKITHATEANDFLSYDIKSSSYQCLFTYCNCNLELDINTTKMHYNKVHNIIVVKNIAKKPRGIKQGMYFTMSRVNSGNMNETLIETKNTNYDKPHCSQTLQKRQNHFVENQNEYRCTKYINYVEYNRAANVTKCLIKNCQVLMMGRVAKNIKTHYRTIHKMNINISHREANAFDDDLGEQANINVNDFVVYDKKTCSNQCLFKQCNKTLKKELPIIRKHYHEAHKTIIATESDYIIFRRRRYNELHLSHESDTSNEDTCLIKSELLSDEETSSLYSERTDNILTDNVDDKEIGNNSNVFFKSDYDKPHCSKTLIRPHCSNLILDNYVEYNENNDKSKCLIEYCQKLLSGRKVSNIKNHYKTVHNLKIGINISHAEDVEVFDETAELPDAKISDLVVYDKETLSYRCSFVKCKQKMKRYYLPTIKKHLLEIHKAIIITNYDCVAGKRRRLNESSASNESDISDSDSYSIKNELLSDEEQLLECFQNLEEDENVNYPIKEELISYEEEQLTPVFSFPKLIEKSNSFKITATKQAFFKLCLGLIIERNFPLNLFDDEYFKPLLLPYEQVYNCQINSGLMFHLLCKANDIIAAVLKKTFSNKIVCLELNVVSEEQRYFLILNVRFLDTQTVCNRLIGYLPITNKGIDILQVYEYLSKFNIEKQQLYVTTIAAGWENDEEIYKICNDLCKHNPNIKTHPVWYIQTVLKLFVQKHSADVKSWQELVNYDCKTNTDILNDLIEFKNFMENFSETNTEMRSQLKEADLFLKTFKIFKIFIEKLKEEQYVAGDLYRDWLCCELELKGELKNYNNLYAGKLYEDLMECKNTLLQCDEFIAALYLDARFNFLGSCLLTDDQKAKGKLHLCNIWEKFNSYMPSKSSSVDPLPPNDSLNDDDEYALLNQHISDMPINSNAFIDDMITNCVPTKRQPFSSDILKYWYCRQNNMKDINELTKITFSFSSSQYVLLNTKLDFASFHTENDKYDKFLIKNNNSILEKNFDLLLKQLN